MKSQSKSNTNSIAPNLLSFPGPKKEIRQVKQPNASVIKPSEKKKQPDSLCPNLFNQSSKLPEIQKSSMESSFSLDFSLLTFEEKILLCELGEIKISELFEAFSDLQKNLHIYFKNIKK